MATKRDYYEVLGIPKTASQDDIKNACEKDKHLSDLYSAMTSISKMVTIF